MACVGQPTQTLFTTPITITQSVSFSTSVSVGAGPLVTSTAYSCEAIIIPKNKKRGDGIAKRVAGPVPICSPGSSTRSSVTVIPGPSVTQTFSIPHTIPVTLTGNPVAYSTLYAACTPTTTPTTTTPTPSPSATSTIPSITPTTAAQTTPSSVKPSSSSSASSLPASVLVLPTTQALPATTNVVIIDPTPTPSSTATSISDTTTGSHNHKTGIIAGAVVAGLFGLGLLVLAGYYFWNKYKGHHDAPDEDIFDDHVLGGTTEVKTPSSMLNGYLDGAHAHTLAPHHGQAPHQGQFGNVTSNAYHAPGNAYNTHAPSNAYNSPNAPPNAYSGPSAPPNAYGNPTAPGTFGGPSAPPNVAYASPSAYASYAAGGGAAVTGTGALGYAAGNVGSPGGGSGAGAGVLRRPNSGGYDEAQDPEVYYPTPYVVQPQQAQPVDYYDSANEKRRFAQGAPPSFGAAVRRQDDRDDGQGPYAGGSYY